MNFNFFTLSSNAQENHGVITNPTIRLFLSITIACLALSGCISFKSFVDPTYPKVAYEDLKKQKEPLRLMVVALPEIGFSPEGNLIAFPEKLGTLLGRSTYSSVVHGNALVTAAWKWIP